MSHFMRQSYVDNQIRNDDFAVLAVVLNFYVFRSSGHVQM